MPETFLIVWTCSNQNDWVRALTHTEYWELSELNTRLILIRRLYSRSPVHYIPAPEVKWVSVWRQPKKKRDFSSIVVIIHYSVHSFCWNCLQLYYNKLLFGVKSSQISIAWYCLLFLIVSDYILCVTQERSVRTHSRSLLTTNKTQLWLHRILLWFVLQHRIE